MARRSLTAMAVAASLTAANAFTAVRPPALSRFGAPSRASEPAMTMVASIGKATDPGVTQIVAESSTYDFVKASALEVLLLPRRSQPIATAPPPPPLPPPKKSRNPTQLGLAHQTRTTTSSQPASYVRRFAACRSN
mmetsp:Transcript_45445/g.125404  ORF Transcript_45445/g.125404 Transcript_45445/m.125404 type:complete len:136 (-) Transcript_45445:1594-2001(-)